jgi:hypothetical protein
VTISVAGGGGVARHVAAHGALRRAVPVTLTCNAGCSSRYRRMKRSSEGGGGGSEQGWVGFSF